ncbi:hypothetical protein [Streptomyces mobaraensis]|uniref:hypothetical protein n=1 Tax=Streptomyces mobaraensis TaxID=35621 RepID=UPI001877B2CE|nr:hypothetical protein [Streptomyces mobaraensis]
MTTAGTAWLAAHAASPDAARARWADGKLAEIRTRSWSVAETRYCTVDIVNAMLALGRAGRLGPVLGGERRAWWLLPPGQGAALDGLADVVVHPPGWALHCPPVGEALRGRGWLEVPDGSGRLTDPVALAAALAPATTGNPPLGAARLSLAPREGMSA